MEGVPISLEVAANKFQLWRESRKDELDPIPKHLKGLVGRLLPHYPKSRIAKALKISHMSIDAIQPVPQASNTKIDFTPFQLARPIEKGIGSTCEIVKPNGTRLVIQAPDLTAVIQAFLCSS